MQWSNFSVKGPISSPVRLFNARYWKDSCIMSHMCACQRLSFVHETRATVSLTKTSLTARNDPTNLGLDYTWQLYPHISHYPFGKEATNGCTLFDSIGGERLIPNIFRNARSDEYLGYYKYQKVESTYTIAFCIGVKTRIVKSLCVPSITPRDLYLLLNTW